MAERQTRILQIHFDLFYHMGGIPSAVVIVIA